MYRLDSCNNPQLARGSLAISASSSSDRAAYAVSGRNRFPDTPSITDTTDGGVAAAGFVCAIADTPSKSKAIRLINCFMAGRSKPCQGVVNGRFPIGISVKERRAESIVFVDSFQTTCLRYPSLLLCYSFKCISNLKYPLMEH